MTDVPRLVSAVEDAAAALREAAHDGGALDPMGVDDFAELGGALTDLLARLATWTGRTTPGVAELAENTALREDTGTTPGVRVLQAADHLTEVGIHLGAAHAAAQQFPHRDCPPRPRRHSRLSPPAAVRGAAPPGRGASPFFSRAGIGVARTACWAAALDHPRGGENARLRAG